MELSVVDILLRLVLGLVIGFFIGMTGVGGGVLVVPALTFILKLPVSIAVGTASLFAFLVRILGTLSHFRIKTIDFSASVLFLAGALPGNVMASYYINRRVKDMANDPRALELFQGNLKTFITLVIVLSGGVLILNLVRKIRKGSEAPDSNMDCNLTDQGLLKRCVGVFAGLLAGAVIGATSIGGGVLIIPILIILFGLSISRTVGTSIFITAVLALVMSFVYGSNGQIDGSTATIMAGGSLLGVHWGAKLMVNLPERILQGVVILVIIAALIMMLVG